MPGDAGALGGGVVVRGRGRPHEEAVGSGGVLLPPTMRAGQSILTMLHAWITAEPLVGNLDALREASSGGGGPSSGASASSSSSSLRR